MSHRLHRLLGRHPWHRDARPTQLGIAFLLCGMLLATLQGISQGTVTAPGLGLVVIGATLLSGILAARIWVARRLDDDEPGDDDAGGGGPTIHPPPPAPGGGLAIDWERFERDFQAYAEAVTARAPSAASK